ncbi:disease resistance protein RPV1 [Pyrus x bretschneideri]|uniref:disease resistance protein RPV1 n=1 Tax=Pyrus x bretschneideri TaxID=225117 RepID=UPI00202F8DD3|nr:disease resistance protein RPV1 [Pyrus x bretschneideri]
MEFIGFIQVFNIIVIAIGTLLYMCCRPFSSSSSSSAADSDVADSTAVADDDDADIPPRREKYDVFISFRAEDTRLTFTSHLHDALLQKKIETYIDNTLERGKEIGPALLEAIEKSKISVIVFSQNYASSAWCLDELVHILKCKERYGQMVIPIFYHTNAWDVRKQHRSYGDAFAQHQKRFKVHKWREALANATSISGFHLSENAGMEADLVKEVVKDIWTKLCRKSSCDLRGFVGIESRIEQIESLLGIHSPDACITVGIWGMDGIGKTTLVEALFHRHSSKFEASCFVKNVRKNSEQADGLDRLEKALLKEILEEEVLPRGSTRVQKRLSRTKVLIVLDDVSDSMQMKRLAGNRLRYGTGSRIIITSRDSRTLEQIVEDDKIYEVQGLKGDDALQLFCSRAFKNNSARRTDYKELAEKAVDYARSVPLALIVLGSLFFNCKRKQDWENEFNKLEQFPSESIQGVLRLSYDGLERHEKEIFLDLACFHQGRHVDMVKRMLDVRGFFARAGIRFLIDMSLISTDSKQGRETIEIHGLLEEMGRTIVREQCIEDLGKRNRLFTDEDVYHVLKYKRETSIVQAIRVNWSKIEEQPLKHANFKKMSNLIMLIVDHSGIFDYKFTDSLDLPDSLHYLYWSEYPLESLPSKFSPENLVELHMPYSQVQKLWKEDQILVNLQVIDLRDSIHLTEVPNLSQSLKIVEIYLWGCKSLVEIPWYFQHLDKLTHLNLGGCSSLKYLPEMPGNIQYLDLQESGIKELPESVWSNENISYLSISRCKDLEKLPSNRCKLKVSGSFDLDQCTSLGEFFELPMDISSLTLYGCERLVSLPTNICKLKYLEELDLFRCSKLENFPEILEPMEHLESLNLSGTAVQELHSPFEFLPALKRIQLHGCKWLSSIPRSICKLKYLEELDLSWCSRLENFPEILEPMEHLESLNLSGTAIRQLHSSIEFLTALKEFNLSGCQQLEVFPTSIYRLANLKRLCLYGCWALQKLPLTYTGFLSLEELDLRDSGILEIPDGLVCSTSLKSIYLSRTRIRSIPASIKRASRLSKLNLVGCTQLQSLPELPVLCNVEAEGCTALKKMASSWTALTCLPKK